MQCHDVEQNIDAYLDRELPADRRTEFEAHLASCSACDQAFGPMISILKAPAVVTVPDGLRDRIVRAVEAVESQPATASDEQMTPRRWRPSMLWTSAIAACLGFFAFGWMGSRMWTPPTAPSLPSPVIEPKATVVLSPWVVSAWAQAMATPGPILPMPFVAQALAVEQFAVPDFETAPVIFTMPVPASPSPEDGQQHPPNFPLPIPIYRL